MAIDDANEKQEKVEVSFYETREQTIGNIEKNDNVKQIIKDVEEKSGNSAESNIRLKTNNEGENDTLEEDDDVKNERVKIFDIIACSEKHNKSNHANILIVKNKVPELVKFYVEGCIPDSQCPVSNGSPKKSDLDLKKRTQTEKKELNSVLSSEVTLLKSLNVRKKQKTEMKNAPIKNKELEKRNYRGETALHTACIKKNLEKVRVLLKNGSNPNTKDFAEWTPLIEAVSKNDLVLTEMLLKNGAWVNTPGMQNITALLEAVDSKHIPIIKLLLKHGADINLRSQQNNTPLTLAKGDQTIYALLLNSKPDVSLSKIVEPIFDPDNITSVCCDISKIDDTEKVKEMCEELNFNYRTEFWNEASIIITQTDESLNCECSVTILMGILNGISIVSNKWLLECYQRKAVIPINGYEVEGTKEYPNSGAIRASRLNKYRMFPKLFDGCHISLTGVWQNCAAFSKSAIISLVRESGAKYLFRDPDPEGIPADEDQVMFHCGNTSSPLWEVSHVLLYENKIDPKKEPLLKYNMHHVKSLPVSWFLKSIQTFSICDP